MFLFALGVLGSLFLNKKKNQITPPKAGLGCGKVDVHDPNNPNYQNVLFAYNLPLRATFFFFKIFRIIVFKVFFSDFFGMLVFNDFYLF